MSAPTPASPQPEERALQPAAFGRPSLALNARADGDYARPVIVHAPAANTGAHDQDDDAAGAR
ncbi:hypothetical protein ACIGCZ_35855 [Streptomyces nigra]|uniref:hypothetical protein n=1 Tax=Streptomyces nigra TaxID=1827580 RepID=UPI0037D63AFD